MNSSLKFKPSDSYLQLSATLTTAIPASSSMNSAITDINNL
ncbi:MAG: hypothetical protein AAF630_05940 [Cyanobacteria bacterium P01_C01_bin.38]